jgi:hypothetical protein
MCSASPPVTGAVNDPVPTAKEIQPLADELCTCETCRVHIKDFVTQSALEQKAYREPPPNDHLWRYLDLAKFVSLLDNSALYFCRADKFINDPFEGATGFKAMKHFWEQKEREFIIRAMRQGRQQSGQPSDDSELLREAERFVTGQRDIRQSHEPRRTFITCWHLNADESDAMWQIYSRRSQYMVAIKTTVQRLDKALGEYSDNEIGQVNYIDYKTFYPPLGHQFWFKRHSFAHEREVRAIIKTWNAIDAEGFFEPIQLDVLIEEIVLGPESPGWFEEIVKSIAGKYNQTFVIRSSNMNAEPFF